MLKLFPRRENKQLLTDAYSFNLPQSVANKSDLYLNFKNNPNISNSQASIQMNGLLSYIEAKMPIKLRLKVRAHKTLLNTDSGNAPLMGTPPSVLSVDNFTCTPGCVNNLINKITIGGLDNYTYQQSDSIVRQMNTLLALMQYDQKKLNKEFGLHVDKDIDNFLDYKTCIGSGCVNNISAAVQVAPSMQSLDLWGFKNMLYDHYKWLLERNTKYCILDKKQQSNISNYTDQGGQAIAGLGINAGVGVNGYGELFGAPLNTATAVYQVAYIDIHEDLMAPFLTTRYAEHNNMIKTIATKSEMTVNFEFDSAYLKTMVKCSSDTTIDSIDIEAIELENVHVFGPQHYEQSVLNRANNNSQSLSYNFTAPLTPDIQVPPIKVVNADLSKSTVQFNQNVNIINRYYLLACPCDATQNNTAQRATNVKNLLFLDVSDVKLNVTCDGQVSNVLERYTSYELEKMTADVLGSDDWLEYIDKRNWKNTFSINTLASGSTTAGYITTNYTAAAGTVLALNGTGKTATRRQLVKFIILDMSKIALGLKDGVPLAPNVQYNTNINLQFEFKVENGISILDEPQMMYNVNINQTYTPNPAVYPISLQLGRINSSHSFEQIRYVVSEDDYSDQFMKLLTHKEQAVNNVQIGSGFFGDLWNGIKSVASTVAPIAESVVPIADHLFGGAVKRPTQKRSIYARAL